MLKLQRAKEQNDRLDVENRALRERVRFLDSEKNNLLDQVGNLCMIINIKVQNPYIAAWHYLLLCLSSWQ